MDRRSWSVTAIATTVAATVALFRPAWLPLVEKTFALVGAVWVVLEAFHDAPLEGLLCALIPFYLLYYAFARLRVRYKPAVLAVWLGATVTAATLIAAGVALMPGPTAG